MPTKKEKLINKNWNNWAIVGILLYLSTNMRPDISFAVSQAAHFSSKPRQPHATAVKTILGYLKKTKDHITIIKPTTHLPWRLCGCWLCRAVSEGGWQRCKQGAQLHWVCNPAGRLASGVEKPATNSFISIHSWGQIFCFFLCTKNIPPPEVDNSRIYWRN